MERRMKVLVHIAELNVDYLTNSFVDWINNKILFSVYVASFSFLLFVVIPVVLNNPYRGFFRLVLHGLSLKRIKLLQSNLVR